MNGQIFLRDREVARLFGMSTSWVRGQRFRKRHGMPHILDIDPICLGGAIRYACSDIEALADRLLAQGGASHG